MRTRQWRIQGVRGCCGGAGARASFHVKQKLGSILYSFAVKNMFCQYLLAWVIRPRPCTQLPFLRWGIFLPMGTEDFRKFPTSLIFYFYFFPLSSNAIIKQCNIHIYSISDLGYHAIIYKYYIALYILGILGFFGCWP